MTINKSPLKAGLKPLKMLAAVEVELKRLENGGEANNADQQVRLNFTDYLGVYRLGFRRALLTAKESIKAEDEE